MMMEINKDNIFLIRKYSCHDFCSSDSVASNISLGADGGCFHGMGTFFGFRVLLECPSVLRKLLVSIGERVNA
jgi:hypothetical protein